VLAAQAHGDLRRKTPQNLVLGVYDVPAMHHFFGFRGVGLHKGANSIKKNGATC
jgi:hypothetical protein